MAEAGKYLFAVTRGIDGAALAGVGGLRGQPLEVVEEHGLQAVVCDVDLAEFGELPLRTHLEDLAWVEEVARSHDAVVRAVSDAATAAPVRLVTIYADVGGVRRRLDEASGSLVQALDRVEGCHEWAVKAFAAERPSVDAQPAAASGAPTGAAYLERKRSAVAARHVVAAEGEAQTDRLHEALSQHARASRRLPPQDPRLTGAKRSMVLNGAYLVADDDCQEFRDLVARLCADHPEAGIDAAGPWPPYSFATLD